MSFLSALKAANSLSDIAALVHYRPSKLSYVLYKLPFPKYASFTVPKRSGGTRAIDAPVPELKRLQKNLADGLQNCWHELETNKGHRRPFVHGFIPDRSIMTNARIHRGRRFVFNLDLKDFFPTINFGRVRGYFIKNKDFALPANVATILAQIVCHGPGLPQGAPTSPVISNLIAHALDVRLVRFAKKHGCLYSRYADDITFSTNLKAFPKAIASQVAPHNWIVGAKLNALIEESGFQINTGKTRMLYCDSRQTVTGLVVNRRVGPTATYRRLLRAMTHRLLKHGSLYRVHYKVDPGAKGGKEKVRLKRPPTHLHGMFGFVDFVDSMVRRWRGIKEGPSLPLSSTERVYRRFLMHIGFWASEKPTILCEGKTDNIYLRAAIRKLGAAHPSLLAAGAGVGGKPQYKVRFYPFTGTTARILELRGGADNIKDFIAKVYLKSTRGLKLPKVQHPLIVVIDNDSGAKNFYKLIGGYVKKKVDGLEAFYYLAQNVYVIFTPKAGGDEESKIEDLLPPEVLSVEIGGKKFNPSNDGIEGDTEFGKAALATYVQKHVADISFDNFEPLLQRIDAAIADFANRKPGTAG